MIKREVIENAIENYVGKIKYVYGCKNISTGGVDNSGFVTELLKQSGIDMDTSSGKDIIENLLDKDMAIEVDVEDIQLGDLVYFRDIPVEGRYHIGVIIDSNTYIHARNTKYGVTISFLNKQAKQIGAIRRKEIKCKHCDGKLSEAIDTNVSEEGCTITVSLKCDNCSFVETISYTIQPKIEVKEVKIPKIGEDVLHIANKTGDKFITICEKGIEYFNANTKYTKELLYEDILNNDREFRNKELLNMSGYDLLEKLANAKTGCFEISTKEELWELEKLFQRIGFKTERTFDDLKITGLRFESSKYVPFGLLSTTGTSDTDKIIEAIKELPKRINGLTD